MTRKLGAALAALGASAALASPATAQEVDVSVTSLDRATPVAAFGRVAAWSARNPKTGLYDLIVLRGLRFSAARVTPRSIPFDVDVGPGPDGTTVVSYSRCLFEPPETFTEGLSVLPDYGTARRCRMYYYDVAERRERALGGAAPGVLPSVWRSQVAFLRPGTRSVRSVHVDGGRQRSRGRGPSGSRARSLDLRGSRVASAWRGAGRSWMRLGNFTVGRVSGPGTILGMGFDAGVLFFRSTCLGSPSGCPETYLAYRPKSRDRYSAQESADLVAAAHGGGYTYALLGTDTGAAIGCSASQPCRLIIEDKLEFERAS